MTTGQLHWSIVILRTFNKIPQFNNQYAKISTQIVEIFTCHVVSM